MDCNPLGSSVHGIFQARILEWVSIPFSRGIFLPHGCPWIFLIQGLNLGLLHCRQILYHQSHQGKPATLCLTLSAATFLCRAPLQLFLRQPLVPCFQLVSHMKTPRRSIFKVCLDMINQLRKVVWILYNDFIRRTWESSFLGDWSLFHWLKHSSQTFWSSLVKRLKVNPLSNGIG